MFGSSFVLVFVAALFTLTVEGSWTLRRKRRILDVVFVDDRSSSSSSSTTTTTNNINNKQLVKLEPQAQARKTPIRGFFEVHASTSEHSSGEEKKKERGLSPSNACDDSNNWNLFDCRDLEMSMSMSMPTGPSKPNPPPPVPTPTPPVPSPSTPTPPVPSPSTPPVPSPTPPPVPEPSAPSPSEPTPPTSCNGLTREESFLSILSSVTPAEILVEPETPQGTAFDWIVNTDPLQVDPCTDPTVVQRYVLATFYYSTEGDNWLDDENWLSEASECDWSGVSCDGEGYLVVLKQNENNLQGVLPNELGSLEYMEELDVFDNSIGGTVPSIFGSLANLKLTDMERNRLTGQAFVDLSGAGAIESYRVSFNALTGTVPDLTTYSTLKELWAAGNELEGTIPSSVGSMSNLDSLFLYNNSLTGPIPDLGQLDLSRLQLQFNSLTSSIPEGVYENTKLFELRLDYNMLIGSISSLIGNLESMMDLRLAGNAFEGTLPAEIARLSQLQILRVNENGLSGTIRDAFNSFQDLNFADFSQNTFTGALPASIFDVPAISILYFQENELTGSIPSNFANGPSLRDLYLQDNQLMGTVPSVASGQLGNFTEFRLETNDISGTMPASICALRGDDEEADLVTLIADCDGNPPSIECDCCTACFGGGN